MEMYNFSFLADGSLWGWTILFGLVAYLVGSISAGRIVAKIKGVDLTKSGSGNVGATNAGRSLGKKGFIAVMLGDVVKVVLLGVVFHIIRIYTTIEFSIPLALVFAIIGNNWPIYYKFKGGKGIAAFGGFMLITSWPLALTMIGFLIVALMVGRRVSMASLSATFIGAIMISIYPYLGGYNDVILTTMIEPGMIIAMWVVVVIAFWKHRSNIYRTYKQTEPTVDKFIPFQDFFGKITFTTRWIKEWREYSDERKKSKENI